ncbi:MAG TPA: hypothetical protein VHG30_02445 [Microvirga sp.]|nr:hypothetical protein [Microvirga sp.]
MMVKQPSVPLRDGQNVELRLTPEELRQLDAWIAAHRAERIDRAGAIKKLMMAGLDRTWPWRTERSGAVRDEGLRPDQLTCENDG